MANIMKIFGLGKAQKALTQTQKQKINNLRLGLLKTGQRIQRASQQKCPIEFANLKASAFTMSKFHSRGAGKPSWQGDKKTNKEELSEAFNKATAEAKDIVDQNEGGLKNNPTVVVGHGANYALYVHEDMSANHPRGGQAKYLEAAANEEKDSVIKEIKKSWGK